MPEANIAQIITELHDPDLRIRATANMMAYFAVSQRLRIRKQADYGVSWSYMGFKGILCNIVSKVFRLRQLAWVGNEAQVTESIFDTLIDLLNYTLYGLFTFQENNITGVLGDD
jgi:hypothetical protein